MYTIQQIEEAVLNSLTDDLRYKQYRDKPLPAGCCYVASEAIYHLNRLVGPHHTIDSHQMIWEGVSHWFLHDRITEKVIDITASQFEKTPMYFVSHKQAFLTHLPSKRALKLIARATEKLESTRLTSSN